MAEYYTKFSFTLDVGSSDRVSAAHAIWQEVADDEDYWGFEVRSQVGDTRLWITDDGDASRDVDGAVRYVLLLAERLGLTGRLGFAFAHTASRPHDTAYGGGAVVIDLTEARVYACLDAVSWFNEVLAQFDGGEGAG